MKKVFKFFCYVILGMQSQNNKLFYCAPPPNAL